MKNFNTQTTQAPKSLLKIPFSFQHFLFSICLLFTFLPAHAQVNLYGTSTDQHFTHVFPDGPDYYVLGQDGSQATITRVLSSGAWSWTQKLNMSSGLLDAIVMPNGHLLFVGLTLQFPNQSIIGEIDRNKNLICLNTFESPGTEGIARIEAINATTYLAVGFHTPSTTQDVVIYKISTSNPGCAIVQKYAFLNSPGFQFGNDIVVTGPNTFMICGNDANNYAVIHHYDLITGHFGGVIEPVQYTYVDMEPAGGDLLAAANSLNGGRPHIVRFDANLLPIWETEIFGLTAVNQILVDANDKIYVVGTANNINRTVVVKLDDCVGTCPPSSDWGGMARYLDNGSTAHSGGFIAIANAGLAFVDGREGPGGLGMEDGFVAITDVDITSTECVAEHQIDLSLLSTYFASPLGDSIFINDSPSPVEKDANMVMWDYKGICEGEIFDTCTCVTPKITLSQNGNQYSLQCLPHNAPTPIIGCPTGTVSIGGFFGCVDSNSGDPCPTESAVIYTLTGPNGGTPIDGGTTTNYTQFLFPPSYFQANGLYQLRLSTLCPGQKDSCVCVLDWIVECDSCCTDQNAFLVAVSNVQTNEIYGNCYIAVNGTGLNECMQITWDWGDNSPNEGPFPNNTPLSHTYNAPGPFTVCYTIEEVTASGDVCWQAQVCLDIQVQCDNCPCPIGYIPGSNLVNNSDFSLGNSLFASSYHYTNNNVSEGQYWVGTTPQTFNPGFVPCSDHTTGTGNMMIVNGDINSSNPIVWMQTITVNPNTNYSFSCWIASLVGASPANLQFYINSNNSNIPLGNGFQATSATCIWEEFCETWNSGSGSAPFPVTIRIVNLNTAPGGNDFALDDIAFRQCSPPPGLCICPDDGTPGPNVFLNGSFSSGSGFSSGYIPDINNSLAEGEYWVGSNPSIVNAGFQSCSDHTTGTGNMLVLNGAPNTNTNVWCQNISINTNTTYLFSCWVASITGASPAHLQLLVGNNTIGTGFQASTTSCEWQEYCESWFSGINTNATICILNSNSSAQGNDFAIDDISIRECTPPPVPCVCPNNETQGLNNLTDGSFSAGGVGYWSGYGLDVNNSLIEGEHWVGTNPNLVGAGFQQCRDHTSGSGNMLVANGSLNPGTAVWCETITVNPSTTYLFSCWVSSVTGASPAQLQLYIGSPVGAGFQASSISCEWEEYCESWQSGNRTSATICIVNFNPSAQGNDFALDDISFSECSPSLKDSCCTNFDLFCQNIMNAISISVSSSNCKVTANIGNLPDCDYIQSINWGDNQVSTGPFLPGAMPMHNYTSSSTYLISYIAVEVDNNGNICFEKSFVDTIAVDCNSILDSCQLNQCSPGNLMWQNLSNNYFIQDMVVYQGKLIVAGSFNIGGAQNIAAWDGTTWTSLGSGTNGIIEALAVHNSLLYIGGSFNLAGGNSASNIAYWNGSSWSNSFPGTNGTVYSLQTYGANLVAGGSFSMAGSTPANNIASWNGSAWISLGAGTNNEVHGLGLYYNNLVAGGMFNLAGGIPANHIAMYNGNLWSPLGSGINLINGNVGQSVKAILQYGPDLVVGGRFMDASNVTGTGFIALWNGSGWSSMGTGVNTSFEGIYDLYLYGGELYAGGLFSQIGGNNTINSVAKWDGSNWITTSHAYRLVRALTSYMKPGKTCELFSGGEVFLNTWECITANGNIPKQSINIYPNPTKDEFFVELPEPAREGLSLRIVTLTGQIILNKKAVIGTEIQTMNVSKLAEGLYFLEIISDGRVLSMNRFVKQ